ncbi:hypothetical protein MMC16_003039 [Acarospora aff. strigata]|nr:hypothetical protein [Acarospora aff. strigata]
MGAGDCANALEVMYAEPRVLRHPDTGLPVPIAGIFSRTSTDARFRLPQRFVAGSCTILVDMANIHGSVATSWAFAAAGAHGVVQRCVLRHGNGGIDSRFGFDTTVLSPATMQRSMQQFWQTCVGIMEDYQQRFVLGTQCVRPDLDDAVAAWARAGGKPDEEE